MKSTLPTLILWLLSIGGAAAQAAEESVALRATAAVPAAPASRALAGDYAGTWKGPEASGGDLRLTLKLDDGGLSVTAAAFTFEGAEVRMSLKSLQAEGAKVVLVFDWSIAGSPGQSTLTGELAGNRLAGTYQTKTDTPTSGTWALTRKP